MLTECVNCGFYISSNEPFCPDCGLRAPAEKIQKDFEDYRRNFTITTAVALAIVSSFAVLYLRSGGRFDNFSELPGLLIGGLLFGLAFSVPAGMIIARQAAKNESVNRFPSLKSDATFGGIEDTITMRNFELDRRYHETETLLERTAKSGNAVVKENLLTAREAILAQISRYELQKQKIKLIRLQNRLRPILYYRNLTAAETEILAEDAEETLEEITDIRQNLTNDYAIEFPAAVEPEKQKFLAQLDETKKNCERLRETVLTRRTAQVLRDSSLLQENFASSNEREIVHAVDVFNIQTTLTDFSESFDKLEREYEIFTAKRDLERNY